MKRCPVCRARLRGETTCRRCRSDITDLITLEKQADFYMTIACKYLQRGDIVRARRFCTYSANHNRTEFGDFFASFLEGFI